MSLAPFLAAAAAQLEDDFGFIDDHYYSIFDYPAQLAFGILLYALPGVVFAISAGRLIPRLHISFRLFVASVLPFLFWAAVLSWSAIDISYLEGMSNLIWAVFAAELWAVVLPGILLICIVGLVEQRNRIAGSEAERFVDR